MTVEQLCCCREDNDSVIKRSAHQYQYVKISGRYYCLQQSPPVLAWVLFHKRDDLKSIFQGWLKEESPSGMVNLFLNQYRLGKVNLKILILLLQYQFRVRKSDDMVHLPVYGQVCMPVHKGYKVFDLQRNVVTKVIDPDMNKKMILSEIEHLRGTSKIDYAPDLRNWNVDEGWYEEEYIRGSIRPVHTSHDSEIFLEAFHKEIVPCISSIMFAQKPVMRNVGEYAGELLDQLQRDFFPELKPHERGTEGFICSMAGSLQNGGSNKVGLAFTHGDFCPANILNTADGIRIIDWESAGQRSMLFDFYSYFFFRPVCLDVPCDKMITEIQEVLPSIISEMASKDPDIAHSLSALETVYRRLYYLELLNKLAGRLQTDRQLNIMDFIKRYTEAFACYEQLLNTDQSKSV